MRPTPLLLLFLAATAGAQPPPGREAPPPPPMPAKPQPATPAPPPRDGGGAEVIEPQVTIVQRGENVVQEYRVSGRLYMIKITPPKGPAYFLVDNDGDGNLETRRNDLANPPIPQWVLFRW